jgi:hypothetical protein
MTTERRTGRPTTTPLIYENSRRRCSPRLAKGEPRARAGFADCVDAAAALVRTRIGSAAAGAGPVVVPRRRTPASHRRRRFTSASVADLSLAAAAAAALFLTIGSPASPGLESAAAAFTRAATVTAASAERSGTAVVRITRDGEVWAGTTVRWNRDDVVVARDDGLELRVVDGTLYGPDADGSWLMLGDPASIDPDRGTTPAEYLATIREDVGGVTLRRITGAMKGLTTAQLDDGSTVYRGSVVSRLIARETRFKEGQPSRVLPFGFVAHDEAADANAPLDTEVTVGADGVVREIALTWGHGTWRHVVTYSGLGSTRRLLLPRTRGRCVSGCRRHHRLRRRT